VTTFFPLPALPLALAALLALPLHTTDAQSGRRELVGVVRDPAGAALQGVVIEIAGVTARTNASGLFQLFTADIDTATIVIRHVGFTPIEALISTRNRQWDTVMVQMERTGQRLEEVEVSETRYRPGSGLAGFEERRAVGNGIFVTRQEILDRNTARLSDVLRLKRGVNVVGERVRFVSSSAGTRAFCIPEVWIDGVRARGMEVSDIPATTVEAIELYSSFSSVPSAFMQSNATGPRCGTIVVWTRQPGSQGR
jgi:hypothetical protein